MPVIRDFCAAFGDEAADCLRSTDLAEAMRVPLYNFNQLVYKGKFPDPRVSEILCVSRVRESVIGSKSFTELDGELRFCRGPREGWIGPLGGQIAQRQPDQFRGGLIIREMPLVADTLAHAAV